MELNAITPTLIILAIIAATLIFILLEASSISRSLHILNDRIDDLTFLFEKSSIEEKGRHVNLPGNNDRSASEVRQMSKRHEADADSDGVDSR